MTEPLVSVFLPTHAKFQSGYLKRAVDSVLAQEYKHFEFLIVDDASTDGTAEYVRDLARRDERVRHIRFDTNVGLPAKTLAHAFLQSQGDYLAFIFDDSFFLPRHLTTLVRRLQAEPTLGMVYGQTLMHMPTGPEPLGRQTTLEDLLENNCIGNPAVVLPRWVVSKVGWYDPHIVMKRSCDWDLWTRIIHKYPVSFVPEIVAEEFGSILSDSLGRSNLIFLPLLRRYRDVARDHLLSPEQIVSGVSSINDLPFAATKEEQLQMHILVLQHYVRTANLDSLTEYTRRLLEEDVPEMTSLRNKLRKESNRDEKADLAFLGTAFYMNYRLAQIDAQRLELQEMASSESVFDIRERIASLERAYWSLDDRYHRLMRSRSWKITKPLRDLKRITGSGDSTGSPTGGTFGEIELEMITGAIRSLLGGTPIEQVASSSQVAPEVLSLWMQVFLEGGKEAVKQYLPVGSPR